MRLCVPNCPTCHRPAQAAHEWVSITWPIADPDGSGTFDYRGNATLHWDDVKPDPGPKGHPIFTCGFHTWESEVIEP